LVLTTAACGGDADKPDADSGDTIEGLTVSGRFGTMPVVKVEPEVKVNKLTTEVLSTGEGEPVNRGDKALLNLYIANGQTGKKAVATYDDGRPLSVVMDESKFFPPLVKALEGRPTGSRLAFADTVKDLYGTAGAAQIGLKASDSLVFVVDIMSVTPTDLLDGPEGTKVPAPAGAPTIVTEDGLISRLTFENAPKTPSDRLQVIPLVKGTGERIDGAKIVTMDYLGQVYGRAKPFENSYREEPATFDVGVGQLIKGWDIALRDQRVGSRLMVIVPPKQGYGAAGNPAIKVTGTSTLVFVMDILGVG
jgi:peptidylprolyl isomerase